MPEQQQRQAIQGRLKFITTTIKYNVSDWAFGWQQHIGKVSLDLKQPYFFNCDRLKDGLTLYVAEDNDEVVNEASGMKLNLESIGYIGKNWLEKL